VSNSTFFRNEAFGGGALFSHSATGPFTVTNSTLVANTATGAGTAIAANGPTATLTLRNSLVSGLAVGDSCFTSDSGSITDGGNDISWPDTTCPGTNVDPKLDPNGLRNNGGRTRTVALRWSSPAIDHGNNTTCQVAPVSDQDQRGAVRPVDGDHNGTARCDIGGFEFGGVKPPAPASRSAVSVAGGAEKLTWRHARDALHYTVEVRHNESVVATRTTTTSVTVTIALPTGTYSWTVQACNSHGCSRSSPGAFSR
jgi:hypothetical protein